MEYKGLWRKQCSVCGKVYERKIIPVVNIFTCCKRAYKWDKVIEETV